MKRGFYLKLITILLFFLMSSIFLLGQLLKKPGLTWEYVCLAGSNARFYFGNVLERGDVRKNYCEAAEGSATPTNRPQQMCFSPLENFRKKTRFSHISGTDKYDRWKGNNDPKIGTWDTIRFMTYNVMAGAGAANPNPDDPDEYRLPRIMEILKTANPDILAIQEACSWDKLNPPVVQQVAEELQMNYYFLGESGGMPVALFSKFEIKEATNLPEPFSRAIRAELIAPNGESIYVFNVHLSSGDHESRLEQLIFLVGEMDSYRDKAVIMMGDMNFPDPDPYNGLHSILYDAGWCHPWRVQHHIDHIWTTPSLAPHVQPKIKLEYEQSLEVSDHPPVAHDINIYFPAIKDELHPPLNFSVQRLENDYIFFKEYIDRLTWDANPGNISDPVKYNIYRKIKGLTDCNYELISELNSYAYNYDCRGLEKNDLYTYKITSVDESNRESEPSVISNSEE